MSFTEIFFIIMGFVLLVAAHLFVDSQQFFHRGFAKPDNPDDPNPPLISGPADAQAQRVIDLSQKE